MHRSSRSQSKTKIEENSFYQIMITFADQIVIPELGQFDGTKKAAWDSMSSSPLHSSPQIKALNDLIAQVHRDTEQNYPALMDRARVVKAMLEMLKPHEFLVFTETVIHKIIDGDEIEKIKSLAPVQMFMYLERRRNTDLDPAMIYQKVTENNPDQYKNYASLLALSLPEKKNK